MRKYDLVLQTEVYDDAGQRLGFEPLIIPVRAKTERAAAKKLCDAITALVNIKENKG